MSIALHSRPWLGGCDSEATGLLDEGYTVDTAKLSCVYQTFLVELKQSKKGSNISMLLIIEWEAKPYYFECQ